MNAVARTWPPASRDERVGLAVAAVLHALLLGWLAWKPVSVVLPPPPERMTVTLTQSLGLTSTSPKPAAEAAPDIAPQMGEPAPPAAEPKAVSEPPSKNAPQPAPVQTPSVAKEQPAPKRQPSPTPTASAATKSVPSPRVTPQIVPRPVPAPAPKPIPVAPPKPVPAPPASQAPVARPSSAPARTTPPTSRLGNDFLKGVLAPRTGSQGARPTASPGGSRLGEDFLKGVLGAQNSETTGTPAAATGPAVQSALAGSISRQLKPHWIVPQGVDAEKLVTILSWSLNRDGTLAGSPQVVRQEGVTDANRAQAARHAEQAIRAVQLAAPFNLPAEYYDAWKRVATFRFDRKLSQ